MFYALVFLQFICCVFLTIESVYVFVNINTRMHAYLYIYLIANIVNCGGYMLEMLANSSEGAYMATRLLYAGKVFVPIMLFLFILRFCRVYVPKYLSIGLVGLHGLVWFFIATNDFHHLFYTTITYVNEGLFPHNVYGHGPLYYAYQVIPVIYSILGVVIAIVRSKVLRGKIERQQLWILIIAPCLSFVGFAVFLSGKTGGYDTTNIGFFLASIFMFLALFKYNLVDTEDVVKNNVVDHLDDGVIATDYVGRLAYANEIAKKIIPVELDDKVTEDSGIMQDLRMRAEHHQRVELDGGIYNVSIKPLYENDIFRGNIYILDNMTEIARYTEELEDAREKAETASKVKSEFLSNVSHEIRTPMNAVVGMTEIMMRDDLPDKDMEYLQNIRSSGNALLDIINDILDISKIESGKMEIVPDEYEILTLLNELKVLFETRIGDKPLRIDYDIDEKMPAKLWGDAVRIRQVITNLMNNAIKFTDVGYIKLKVKATTIDPETVDLFISVKDSGLGIKDEDREKLFESFSQVDVRKNHGKEGTGLGLPLCKQLIELMGGELSLDSVYGEGSDFYFTIRQNIIDSTPASEYHYTKKGGENIDFTAPDAKVLLVEDNELNQKVVLGLLEPTKINIDIASNGIEALRRVTDEEYDMVFMDHLMPVMDGIEATQRIREFKGEYYKLLPIIALSANATEEARKEFEKSGMNDFVAKPIEINEMKAKIRKWLPDSKIKEAETVSKEKVKGEERGKDENMGLFNFAKKEEEANLGVQESVKEETSSGEMKLGELDRETGISYCGDEELYNEILEDFYKLIDSKSEKIEDLRSSGNIKDYVIEVHALKSTARMIGATALSEQALELEMAGKADNVDLITEKTPTLLKMYRAYKDTLSYFDKDDAPKEEASDSDIKATLEKMLNAANEFDMDGMDDAMAALNGFKMPNDELQSKVKKLDLLVRDVAFEDVKVLVKELQASI